MNLLRGRCCVTKRDAIEISDRVGASYPEFLAAEFPDKAKHKFGYHGSFPLFLSALQWTTLHYV